MRTPTILIAAVLAAGAAFAQQTGVAQLKGVKGSVLLSRESGLAAGSEASRIMEHTRVITTANAEAVIVYDNGCQVTLKQNQRAEIDSTKACAALVAEVETILLQPAGLAAGSAGTAAFWSLVPVVGGIGIGTAVLHPGTSIPPPLPLSPS